MQKERATVQTPYSGDRLVAVQAVAEGAVAVGAAAQGGGPAGVAHGRRFGGGKLQRTVSERKTSNNNAPAQQNNNTD